MPLNKRNKGSQARTFYLTNDVWEASKELAERERIPHSQLIRKAIIRYVKNARERDEGYAHRLATGFYD